MHAPVYVHCSTCREHGLSQISAATPQRFAVCTCQSLSVVCEADPGLPQNSVLCFAYHTWRHQRLLRFYYNSSVSTESHCMCHKPDVDYAPYPFLWVCCCACALGMFHICGFCSIFRTSWACKLWHALGTPHGVLHDMVMAVRPCLLAAG